MNESSNDDLESKNNINNYLNRSKQNSHNINVNVNIDDDNNNNNDNDNDDGGHNNHGREDKYDEDYDDQLLLVNDQTDQIELEDLKKYLNDLKIEIDEKNRFEDSQQDPTDHHRHLSASTNVLEFEITRNERLWRMKIEKKFIDSVILIEDHKEFLHLDLLISLRSDIDQALTYIGDLESNDFMIPIRQYRLDDSISSDSLRQLINFAYHHRADLNEKNCIETLRFASKYRIDKMISYCFDHIRNNRTISNVIKSIDLARNFHCPFRKEFEIFIADNFEEIVAKHRSDLLALNVELIMEILSQQSLNVSEEEFVWEILKDWIEIDRNERCKFLIEFLSKPVLRIGRLNEDFVRKNILASDLFQSFPYRDQIVMLKSLQDQSKSISFRDGRDLFFSEQSIFFKPRATKELIIVAGGWLEGRTTDSIEIYDYQTNLWLQTNIRLRYPVSYFGFEILDNNLYVFGGSNGRDVHQTMWSLNLDNENDDLSNGRNRARWIQKCSMIEKRCYVSSAVLNGFIYAIGGFNQLTRIRKCERYNKSTNSWQEIADLNHNRSDACVAVLNDKIFIAGGINDACVERSVEIYYPESNHWRLIKSMQSPRTSFAICAFQNKIWALGGNDGSSRIKTVECFNDEEESWIEMDPMLVRRSTFKAIVLRDELYVMGGFNGQSPICNVEKYVPSKGWRSIKEMRHDRSGHSVICIPNRFSAIQIGRE
ncbi:Kelch-like protein 10 [Sarcoptes scabiei]|uniref:Kelch-like protein 10 n=1 Tax=Sarcoptes scabiei TaxID=52283 RepID=A0A834VHI1_SARSC|nr:Kelch-like protein 10 [Sarcoptes scabiei]